MINPAVDVIIPVYHPDGQIQEMIRRLLAQTYPVNQIHLIHTRDESEPKLDISGEAKIKVSEVSPEQFDHGGTRDKGAKLSGADVVVFMTQDAMPLNTKLIEALIRPFEDEKVGASYGRQLPNSNCSLIERYTRSFNYPEESRVKSEADLEELGIKTYFCSNVCAAYSKKIYESLGGFEEKVIFNEDMILASKIIQSGGKVAYAAEAAVIHSHNYSGWQQFRRNFDLAVSQAEHPEIFSGVRSESEGIRLVRKTAAYVMRRRKPWLLFPLVWSSGCKYLGYCMGKRYKSLPNGIIRKCTMNPAYWKEQKTQKIH